MTAERKKQIVTVLLNDGINSTLVNSMSDAELEIADGIEDYNDFTDYLNHLMQEKDI